MLYLHFSYKVKLQFYGELRGFLAGCSDFLETLLVAWQPDSIDSIGSHCEEVVQHILTYLLLVWTVPANGFPLFPVFMLC